jgi:hypothetical protein
MNSLVDKHPFNTGTLIIMLVVALSAVYGILYLILRNKK